MKETNKLALIAAAMAFSSQAMAYELRPIDDWYTEKKHLSYAYLDFKLTEANIATLSDITIRGDWQADISYMRGKKNRLKMRLFTSSSNPTPVKLKQNRGWFDQYRNRHLKNYAFEGEGEELSKYLGNLIENGNTPIFMANLPNITSTLITLDR